MGSSWQLETEIFLERDLREPFLLAMGDRLFFIFFEGGVNPVDFEPLGLFRFYVSREAFTKNIVFLGNGPIWAEGKNKPIGVLLRLLNQGKRGKFP